ncbi:MAG: hypothetical protein ACOZAN_00245 [Patescibacteria group bacterium]
MTALKNTFYQRKISVISILLATILIFAGFFRLYNLRGSLQFQGDQGRDAIIVAKMFLERDMVFIGPVTSVGNMYLGPLYYYFMLPFLFISFPSPMGPVYAVAFLGILTVFLTYWLGQEMIGKKASMIAAAFMAFSATATLYSRFSWNPNPAPLVSLLMIYSLFKALKKNVFYWILVAVFFSILIQLHYLTLLSAVALAIIWVWQLISIIKKMRDPLIKKGNINQFIIATFTSVVVVIMSMAPLILFDIKHQGLNAKAFQSLISHKENFTYSEPVSIVQKLAETVAETEGRSMHVLFEITIGKNRPLNRLLYLSVFVVLAFIVLKRKDRQFFLGEAIVITFLLTGIIGTAFYQHTIFDHYIAYLFPVTFLIYGIVGNWLCTRIWGKLIVMLFALVFLSYNLPRMPLKSLGWQVDDIERTSQEILKRVAVGDKYNIVLLSESKDHYGQNYRYFLVASDKPPVEIENGADADKLFIINEEKKTKDVTGLPIYDLVVFPNKTVKDFFVIDNGPEITLLEK